MSARVLQFPQSPFAGKQMFRGVADARPLSSHSGLHLISAATRSMAHSTQFQAHRIVAQVEREITAQAYARVEQRYRQQTPAATVVPFEAPASVAGRIFQAIRSFACSA